MFQTNIVEEIKTHILCSITFPENRAVYGKMWKNMVEAGRTHSIIRRIRFACWKTKATNTLRIFNTYCFSAATVVTRTRSNITLYAHYLSCYTLHSP